MKGRMEEGWRKEGREGGNEGLWDDEFPLNFG
jgi:hypothetical protein